MMLNEISDQMRMKLPPSDSRIRPDIRAMENGDIGEWLKTMVIVGIFSIHPFKMHASASCSD